MVQFFGTTYVTFYTDRKNDTLRNETNSIKEQERMGNIQGTGNIMGTILGYILNPWSMSLAPTNGATGGTANKKILSRGKKLVCMTGEPCQVRKQQVATCVTKA